MSTYVIGDIQGCLDELKLLLKKIKFSADKDIIWFTGDLVNRGPKSLETLRFVKSMEENAVSVLGNHDLHMLAIAYGLQKQRPSDTFDSILNAEDKEDLMEWVSNLPLIHTANEDKHILVHAGIYPKWDIKQTKQYAVEVETVLRGDKRIEFLSNMYGNEPEQWNDQLSGKDRLRFITNTLTRMRYCTKEAALDLKSSVAPGKQDKHLVPWYSLRNKEPEQHIFFGHWSTLGLLNESGIHCLDTGCLWGGTLSAMEISQDKLAETHFSIKKIDCAGNLKPFSKQ